jgi:hypothetical protein
MTFFIQKLTITKQITNDLNRIFSENELERSATIKNYLIVQIESNR